ncbi:MAG: DUF2723 domain-containing protein [Bacteroidetes bacterium]|nr:DUF2723 domain-containing protein [Bacteroidota bacterium]MBU1679912.1 DUF2723 domain-containing protein [Bacteroidota bacterium]MBU2506227.1 DUF2723 domain-containing protein [Bacteroidota bacterium]
MDFKKLHRVIGAGVFLLAGLVYLLTVQPSVSFWDCGEFIASSHLMQVPHPPGTPFFLILGRLFALIPFADNIAFRVNLVSVISSALTVLLLYLIAVKLIENYKGKTHTSLLDALGTFLAAAIGALSLAFSDTFWFNAVEAEVYALSTFFIAFVTWLMMVWNEKADNVDNEKYLIMIAYTLGISTGVHLMSVLATVPIVMTVMFRKYLSDEAQLITTAKLFIIHAVIILIIAVGMWAAETGSSAPSPEAFRAFDQRFIIIVGVATIIFMAALRKKIFARNSFYLPFLIGGAALVAIYPGFVKYVPKFVSLLGGDNYLLNAAIFAALFSVIGFTIYWSNKTDRQTLHLISKAVLFTFLGYTSYTMILIRSNQDTPINLNSPKTMTEFLSYVNREQYGDFPTFKRRYSQESHQQDIYTQYSSDLDFFWNYQMNHMFNRYLAWNYIGRVSTEQDEGIDYTKLWALPFLLGLFGFIYHFKKDWKMGSIFLAMFIFLGYLTVFYQNQQQPQPRERDYFYVGAFFVYSIWIAIGMRGILDLIVENFGKKSFVKPLFSASIIVGFLAVPVLMLAENFWEHDRSRNFVPWDYSYNMLQSVAPNAVIFTNGDNDTFPLWYLQDVEGVRRDVRIANLSLLNTGWYIKQLKNTTPHGAAKIKMNISDRELDEIGPVQWESKQITVDVPKKAYTELGITDTSLISKDKLTWKMDNTIQFGRIKAVRVQDLVALEMVKANNWERPIYFAVTCSENSRIGLDDYLKMEGLAFRLVPEKRKKNLYYVDEELMRRQLFEEPADYKTDYAPGFKFRGLNDPTIFMDENHQRLVQNYRNSYLRLSIHYLDNNNNEMAIASLDKMEEKLPRRLVDLRYELLYDLSNLYYSAGGMTQYKEIGLELEALMRKMIEDNPRDFNRQYNPYIILKDVYENLGEYNKLVDLFSSLKNYVPNDPTINSLLERYRKLSSMDSIEVFKDRLDLNN